MRCSGLTFVEHGILLQVVDGVRADTPIGGLLFADEAVRIDGGGLFALADVGVEVERCLKVIQYGERYPFSAAVIHSMRVLMPV